VTEKKECMLHESRLSRLETEMKNLSKTSSAILEQTIKHNGRLTRLEEWKAYMSGIWKGSKNSGALLTTSVGVVVNVAVVIIAIYKLSP
jgi:hypothetical protein